MHNLVTIREISATVAALLIATIATWLPTATPEAKAQTLAVNMIDHSLKADP
jgi:hypothetical protein